MPRSTRWFVRTSMVYLVAALLYGVFAAAPADLVPPPWRAAAAVSHIHLWTIGWLSQLIFGVALWLFPIADRDRPRGPQWLVWSVYGGLNTGLLLRILCEPSVRNGSATALSRYGLWSGTMLLWLAGAAFVVLIWKRVR